MIEILAQVADARSDRLRFMQEHFKEPDPQAPVSMLVAILAVLAVFVVMKLLQRLQNRRQDEASVRPMALYLRVQSRMGLPLIDRWRLWRLAKATDVANPTALLISASLFDQAVQKYTGGRPGSSRGAPLTAIRHRLFGPSAPLSPDLLPAAES